MGWYGEQVVPRVVHLVLTREPFRSLHGRCLVDARGRVLDLGSGSGLSLPSYGPALREVLALEPSAVARHPTTTELTHDGAPALELAGDAHALPLADASVDTVVSTRTLCSQTDPVRALAESRRVLRPDGRLLFLEHVRSPKVRTARRQDRLTPLQRRLAGGRHLGRAIPNLIREAGLRLERLGEFDLRGIPVAGYHVLGCARPG